MQGSESGRNRCRRREESRAERCEWGCRTLEEGVSFILDSLAEFAKAADSTVARDGSCGRGTAEELDGQYMLREDQSAQGFALLPARQERIRATYAHDAQRWRSVPGHRGYKTALYQRQALRKRDGHVEGFRHGVPDVPEECAQCIWRGEAVEREGHGAGQCEAHCTQVAPPS